MIEILGIDLSHAFDTIRREKLLSVLHSFLYIDNVQIIRLSETNITVRVDDALSARFNTTVDTPQGDSLSPVLFIVFLEAALRTLCGCLPRRPPADINLQCEAIYADDIDLISTDPEYLSKVNEIAPAALGEWLLYVNVDKTERTNIKREIDCVAEKWRTRKKLGALLGDVEDVRTEKCLRLPLSVPCGLFGCEDKPSASD